jgi:hypothetical protein
MKPRRSGSRSSHAGALRRHRVNHAFVQQTGRRGLRSRVVLSDGIARWRPGALDDEAIEGRTTPWTFRESIRGRKARIGIGPALGSPSVLPKEDAPDRPLTPLFTEEGRRRSWLERAEMQSLQGRRISTRERQACQKLDRARATSANTRGQKRAIRRKRATTS